MPDDLTTRPDGRRRTRGVIAKVIGACFALSAFAVAVISGMTSGQDPVQVLVRSLLVLVICYPVGYVAGVICHRVVEDHLQQAEAAAGVEDVHVNLDAASSESGMDAGSDSEEIITV